MYMRQEVKTSTAIKTVPVVFKNRHGASRRAVAFSDASKYASSTIKR